jgi:hypothetical protein
MLNYLFACNMSDIESDAEEQSKNLEVPWTYNHLHDLESLWWVLVIVFNNRFSQLGVLPTGHQQLPNSIQDALFPPILAGFHHWHYFLKHSHTMDKTRLPTHHHTAVHMLDHIQQQIIKHYKKVQLKLPDSITLDPSDGSIYSSFKKYCRNIQGELPEVTLIFIPELHAEEENAKREREQSDVPTNHQSWLAGH